MSVKNILLLDIGNTRTKAANLSQQGLGEIVTLTDEQQISAAIGAADEVCGACVRGVHAWAQIEALCKKLNKPLRRVTTERSAFGVTNAYEDVSRHGVDRWLAILGARYFYPDSQVLVIDAGTAVTFDFVDADGLHAGGWILPGLALMKEAISSKAPDVFSDQAIPPSRLFSAETSAALGNGVLAAHLALIEKCHLNYPQAKILLTGGDGELLQSMLENVKSEFLDNLVFVGLSQYGKKTVG